MLFLDEPTSGLDAFAAETLVFNVAQVVKERNIGCLMTVHQPSWSVFCKLDTVILLAKGGVFYQGSPRDAISWFEELGYVVPEGVNPADYFITLAENADRDEAGKQRVQALIDAWSSFAGRTSQASSERSISFVKGKRARHNWPVPWFKEFGVVYWRWVREGVSRFGSTADNQLRDKQTNTGSIFQSVFFLLLIGSFPLQFG